MNESIGDSILMHYDKYLFLKIKEYLNYHEYCGSSIKTKV
jgi:hypothetical protein